MTVAVETAPSHIGAPRDGRFSGPIPQIDLNRMNPDDYQRYPSHSSAPRRMNSSSSLSSNGSSSSTATMVGNPTSARNSGLSNGDNAHSTRKKPVSRGMWPLSKSEPVSGISTARTQSSVSSSSASATSGLSALHNTNGSGSYSYPQSQANNLKSNMTSDTIMLSLTPMNGTFERKTIQIPFEPDVLKVGRQTNTKTYPAASNGYFDSKVLSRQHAEIWATRDGKIWIRDVKSSNGTFVNSKRLSQENKDSDPHSLELGDTLELGIDIVSEDQTKVIHHKVAAKVDHAGFLPLPEAPRPGELGDFDPMIANQLLPSLGQGSYRRPVSQASSTHSTRLSTTGSAYVPYSQRIMQPISIEKIMNRLHSELRQAQSHSQDLKVTSDFVGALISSNEQSAVIPVAKETSPTKSHDIKARFATEPPAPPPSQPLPEKPDIASRLQGTGSIRGVLTRADTERPKTNADSPEKGESGSQILNLVEALRNAEREISSQADRLREMESALQEERNARSNAEQRAVRLESVTNAPIDDLRQSDVARETDIGLQQRVDAMRNTIDEMKVQMESYRQRAQTAEDESKRDRQSLAELVEGMRRRRNDNARTKRHEKHFDGALSNSGSIRSDSTSHDQSADDEDEHTPIDDSFSDDELDGEIGNVLNKHLIRSSDLPNLNGTASNGHATPLSDSQLKELSSVVTAAAESLRKGGKVLSSNGELVQITNGASHDRMTQTAPYVSIIGVVFIGVGMMAWLNGWSRPER